MAANHSAIYDRAGSEAGWAKCLSQRRYAPGSPKESQSVVSCSLHRLFVDLHAKADRFRLAASGLNNLDKLDKIKQNEIETQSKTNPDRLLQFVTSAV